MCKSSFELVHDNWAYKDAVIIVIVPTLWQTLFLSQDFSYVGKDREKMYVPTNRSFDLIAREIHACQVCTAHQNRTSGKSCLSLLINFYLGYCTVLVLNVVNL